MLSTTTVTLLASLTSLSRVEKQVAVAAQRTGSASGASSSSNEETERILAETRRAQDRIGNAVLRQTLDTRV